MSKQENNKKGFTLIEIIVAIALIVVISVTTIVLLQKDNTNIEQEKKKYMSALETSANVFMETYKDKSRFKTVPGEAVYIELSELIDEGYIDENKVNPFGEDYSCIKVLKDILVGDVTMELVDYKCPTNVKIDFDEVYDIETGSFSYKKLPSSLEMLEMIKEDGLFNKLINNEITMAEVIENYIKEGKIEIDIPDLILKSESSEKTVDLSISNIESIQLKNPDDLEIETVYYEAIVRFSIKVNFEIKTDVTTSYEWDMYIRDLDAPILYNANYDEKVSDNELSGEEFLLGNYSSTLNISNVKYDSELKKLSRHIEDEFQIITINNNIDNKNYINLLEDKNAFSEDEKKDIYFYFDNFFGFENKTYIKIDDKTANTFNFSETNPNPKFLNNETYELKLYNFTENIYPEFNAYNTYEVYFNYVDILPPPQTMYVGPDSVCDGETRVITMSEFENEIKNYYLTGKGSGIIDVFNEGQDYSAVYTIEFCNNNGECNENEGYYGYKVMLKAYSNKYQDKDSFLIKKLADVEACGYNDVDPRTRCELWDGGYWINGNCLSEEDYCRDRCCGMNYNSVKCKKDRGELPLTTNNVSKSFSGSSSDCKSAECIRSSMIKNSENWHKTEAQITNSEIKEQAKNIFHEKNMELSKQYAAVTGKETRYDSSTGIHYADGVPIYTSADLNS